MTVKLKEPNPLNVFNIRQTRVKPIHFESIAIPYTYNVEEALNKWIRKNLKGRFYVGKVLKVDDQNQINNMINVAFEDGKELAYFMLACPLLKYK
tara:strand:- start:4810 stop:5094 length:285 start_codon:yes stop_codon:yes gene_type:complete